MQNTHHNCSEIYWSWLLCTSFYRRRNARSSACVPFQVWVQLSSLFAIINKALQWNLWLPAALYTLLSWTTLQTFSEQRSVNGSSWTADKQMLKYPCPINLRNACQFTMANFIKCSTRNICKRFNNKQKLRHVLTQERLLAKHKLSVWLVPV